MDNLSHTLVGVALAQVAVGRREALGGAVTPGWRRTATALSVFAANAPDLDLFVTGLTDGKLGYLLHHRGHTHTLVFLPVVVIVALAVGWGTARARGARTTREDATWLGALTATAALSHLALDYLNSYGVHPFWPFDNRWSYGDTLFILDPSVWLVLAVPLFLRRLARATRGMASLLAGLAWTMVFAVASGGIKETLRTEFATQVPGGALVDLALTPSPMNPLCWRVIAVSLEGEDFVVRDGQVKWWRDVPCLDVGGVGVAPIAPVTAWTASEVAWRGEFRRPQAHLRELARRCDVEAFLRFARTPFWTDDDSLVADLRFDRGGRGGFAAIDLAPAPDCPGRLPPWVPPLEPILQTSK